MIPKCCQNCPNLNKGPCSCTFPSLEEMLSLPDPAPDFVPTYERTITNNTFSLEIHQSIQDYSDIEILKEFERRFRNSVLKDLAYTRILEEMEPKFIRKYLKSIKSTKEFV